MEDEQGDGGPVSVNLPSENLVVENLEGQSQVESFVEEEEGEEIMVEVVGSDVFVDGVSGEIEPAGDGGLEEGQVWEKREETEAQNIDETMELSKEEYGGNKLGESEKSEEQNHTVQEEQEVGLGESVDDESGNVSERTSRGVDDSTDEARKPRIGAAEKTEVDVESTSMAIGEEKEIKDESVERDSSTAVGVVLEGEVNVADEVEKLESSDDRLDADSLKSHEENLAGSSVVVSSEVSPNPNPEFPDNEQVERIGEVSLKDKDDEILQSNDAVESQDLVDVDSLTSHEAENVAGSDQIDSSEVSPNPNSDNDQVERVDGVLEEEVNVTDRDEKLQSSDVPASHDSDSLTSHEPENLASSGQVLSSEVSRSPNPQIPDNEKVERIDGVVEYLAMVDASAENPNSFGADSLTSHKPETLVASDHVLSSEVSPSPKPEVPDNEQVERIDAVVEDVAMVDASVENANDRAEIDPTAVDCTIPVSVTTISGMAGSKDGVFNANIEFAAPNGDCVRDAHNLLRKYALAADSKASDVRKESFISESVEGEGMDFDIVLDFKDGESDVNLPDITSEKDECLKTDADMETNTVQQNHVFSNEEIKPVDGGETAEIGEGESVKLEISGDKEIVQEDSNEPLDTDVPLSENDQKIAISDLKDERSDAQILDMPIECQGSIETPVHDASNENIPVSERDALSKVSEKKEFETDENLVESNNLVGSTQVGPDEKVEDGSSLSKEQEVSAEVTMEEAENKSIEVGEDSNRSNENQSQDSELELKDAEEKEIESGSEEPVSEADKLTLSNEKFTSLLRMNQPGYLSRPENEGRFAVSDLVWGKVRSHPWWPGQIFDPADASEKAVKYYKKDSYLVGYFGDRTFAWNDASVLKPFRSHFSQIEKQTSSESFQNAVTCALEEVSRRVELGLACSCIPKNAFEKLETQFVENTGVRAESSQRRGFDPSARADSFEPDKLLQYVKDLASRAISSRIDRIDLVIARAQLTAFCRFKGYRLPTGFPQVRELLEKDEQNEMAASHKRKHTPKESSDSRKERSLTELMGGDVAQSEDEKDPNGLASGKKRKALDSLADGSEKRVSIYAAKVSTQTPKPSFKIGECIRRVASQLTGGTSSTGIDGSPKISEQPERLVSSESSPVNEMLLHLQMIAEEPKKEHSFAKTVVNFFSGFRNSVVVNKRGRKKKTDNSAGGPAEEFEFDDVNDSYWTDRIVQNYSEVQLLQNNNEINGVGNLQLVPFDEEKPIKPGRRSNSRKRYSTGNYPTEDVELENIKRRKQESSPAELILNFAERNSIPSEINLNKMFRRFGPLMESETEVDHDLGRARVIFKRGSDAEVAHDSAEKFNIFGPVLVNYQIGYSPLISVKILPLELPQDLEDATLML